MNSWKIFFNPFSCMHRSGKTGKWIFDINDVRDRFFFLPSISYDTSVGYVIQVEEEITGERMEYWISFAWLRFKFKILLHASDPEWSESDA